MGNETVVHTPGNVVMVAKSGAPYISVQAAVDAVAANAGWTSSSKTTRALCTVYPAGNPCDAADAITVTVYNLGADPIAHTFTYGDISHGVYTQAWAFARAINERFAEYGLVASLATMLTGELARDVVLDAVNCLYFTVTYNAAMTTRLGDAAPTLTNTTVWESATPEIGGAVEVHPGTYSGNVRLHSNVRLVGIGKPIISGDFAVAPGYDCEWKGLYFQPDPTNTPKCIVQMDYVDGKVDLHEFDKGIIREYPSYNDSGNVALVSLCNSDASDVSFLNGMVQTFTDYAIPVTVGLRVHELETTASKARADYIRRLSRSCGWEFTAIADNSAAGDYPIALNSVRDALLRYAVTRYTLENLVDTRLTNVVTEFGATATTKDSEWSKVPEFYQPVKNACRGWMQPYGDNDDLHIGVGGLDLYSAETCAAYLPNKIRAAMFQWFSGNLGSQIVYANCRRDGFRAGSGIFDISSTHMGRWSAAKFDLTAGQTDITFGSDMETFTCDDGELWVEVGDSIGNDTLGFLEVTAVSTTTVTVSAPGFAVASQAILWNASRFQRKLTEFGQQGRQTILSFPAFTLTFQTKMAEICGTVQRAGTTNFVTVSGLFDAGPTDAYEANYLPDGNIDEWTAETIPTASVSPLWSYKRGFVFYSGASVVSDGTHNWIRQTNASVFRVIADVTPGYSYKIRWKQRSAGGATLNVFGCYGKMVFGGNVGESITRGYTKVQTWTTTTDAAGEVREIVVGMDKDSSRLEVFFCPNSGTCDIADISITRV